LRVQLAPLVVAGGGQTFRVVPNNARGERVS
jgi:hypothetical protein